MYDYPNQQDDDDGCHLNPHNRFLLIFCHASDVSEGWGCVMCGGRTFSFKCGVVIFSIVMAVGAVNDFIDMRNMDDFKNNKDKFFVKMFYAKLASDALILLGILFSVASVFGSTYCPSVLGYYSAAISFYLNTFFCVFILTQIKKQNVITFLKNCFKGTFLTYLSWCFFDYVLLFFAWMLFCNMINLRRRRRNIQNNFYDFQYNF